MAIGRASLSERIYFIKLTRRLEIWSCSRALYLKKIKIKTFVDTATQTVFQSFKIFKWRRHFASNGNKKLTNFGDRHQNSLVCLLSNECFVTLTIALDDLEVTCAYYTAAELLKLWNTIFTKKNLYREESLDLKECFKELRSVLKAMVHHSGV